MIQEEVVKDSLIELVELATCSSLEVYGKQCAPDYSALLCLTSTGALKAYGAREKGELVGYALFVISPKLLEKNVLCADCVSIYVRPEYRGTVSLDLMRFVERALAASGVAQIQYRGGPQLQKLFQHFGYRVTEYTFVKEV